MARRRVAHRTAHLAVNHERWLVSYADFITLLFAFFVVMYSVSQVSETKYRVLSDTLVSTFKFQSQTLNPIQVGQPSLSSDPSVIENSKPKLGEGLGEGAFEKQRDLPHMAENLSESLADLIDRDLVSINSNEFWLEIELNSNVLFSSASATPSTDAKLIFAEIAKHLLNANNPIQVEGYTDSAPIQTSSFPSNWELSASRATAVVKLLAQQGIAPDRLSAVGYGEFQPIADNSTEAGRAQNRRVVLMVARDKVERPARSLGDIDLDAALGEGTFSDDKPDVSDSDASAVGLSQSDIEFNEAPSLKPLEESQPGVDVPKTEAASGRLTTEGGLKAIKLESGGILFTSDPARLSEQTKD